MHGIFLTQVNAKLPIDPRIIKSTFLVKRLFLGCERSP
jgi:hypothetical protein